MKECTKIFYSLVVGKRRVSDLCARSGCVVNMSIARH